MVSKQPPPSIDEEMAALAAGRLVVAGVDEAGRGCLAGPIAAAAVVLPLNEPDKLAYLDGVRDSKLLLAKARDEQEVRILDVALGVGFSVGSVEEIAEVGIVGATRLAMARAIAALPVRPDFLLIDALKLPEVDIEQKSIIHGDALCLSISAASIIAKVGRDRIMMELDHQYPGYGFAQHKGYGTRGHQEALRTLGLCALHRKNFRIQELLDSLEERSEPEP